MRGSLGWFLLGALGGCTPAADAPVPAPPPDTPHVVVDGGHASAAEGGEVEGQAQQARSASAPEAVPSEINARYAEQTDPQQWARRFEREGREAFDHRDEIIAALGLSPGDHVADVGAGTGLFTMALARTVGSRGVVHAVDVQAYFLDHIEQAARKEGLTNVKVVRAQQDSVQLAEGSVDLVLMCDAYHHVEQPAAYLASLYAAIKPGGRLVVVDYIAIPGQSREWLLEHIRATPQEFRAEIEGAGFRFVRAREGMLEENFFFEFERP